jgi:HEAT repeat protein
MKVNQSQLNGYLARLSEGQPSAQREAIKELTKYADSEWEGNQAAVEATIAVLLGCRRRSSEPGDVQFRIDSAKVLGNIGTKSKEGVRELLRLLRDDPESAVQTEAARSLGKIGTGALIAEKALVVVLRNRDNEEALRCEAAWALAKVAPEGTGVKDALRAAANDSNPAVGVIAAEALWRATGDAATASRALITLLHDLRYRAAAAQVIYRMGSQATGVVPALLAAAKDKDRLFRESVLMALQKIDPAAAFGAGTK